MKNLLSARELEVLKLIARGKVTKEIADILFISYETVRTHIKNMRRKLGARTNPHAVAIAKDMGLI